MAISSGTPPVTLPASGRASARSRLRAAPRASLERLSRWGLVVRVFKQLQSSGFPSGHVLTTTAFCGFLAFLAFTLLKPSAGRTGLIVVLALLIALMGPSRIFLGQHWFSDVMGAYLFGSLWLALTTHFYRWGKVRFFVHQPMAPAAPPTSNVGTA